MGAGPGDPGLITLKGQGLLKHADVVVVDALVNPVLLRRLKARIIYVGKRGPGAPHGPELSFPQEKINQLLVRLGRQGKQVVRLKGGDPFVFGRGSEELEALRAAHVKFEVVPGISSAIAAPAAAGIPVTDRRWASQVTFVTGHGQAKTRGSDAVAPPVNWKKFPPQGTLVILMGVASWKNIRRGLLAAGFPSSRSVAAIESGTTPAQRVIQTSLGESGEVFHQRGLVSPAVIVVGDVVRLAQRFSWMGQDKPLFGKRVAVTRPLDQSGELVMLLERQGAEVLVTPAIQIRPLPVKILLKSHSYDGIIFLSANAVLTFTKGLTKKHGVKKCPAICIGSHTHQIAKEHHWRVMKTPDQFSSAGLLRLLGRVKGKRFLVPRTQKAPPGLVANIRKRGATIEEVVTYETLPLALSPAMRRALLEGVDAITFTSASTVRNFLNGFTSLERKKIFKRATAISMGAQTTAALRSSGVKKIKEAKNATLLDLMKAIPTQENFK